MAIYLSNRAGHSHTIRNAKVVREADADGLMRQVTLRPQLDADFHPLRLTEAERLIGDRQWKLLNPNAPYGSVPYAQGDAMGQEFSTEDVIPGTRYVGHDPSFRMGKFDSAHDIDYESQGAESEAEKAELRRLVEDTLNNHETLNKMYIRIDQSLPKPWPNYPMESGPGVAQKIVAAARDFGISMWDVIEFEKTQDKPRPYVIAEIELELAKEKAADAERAALGAVVA